MIIRVIRSPHPPALVHDHSRPVSSVSMVEPIGGGSGGGGYPPVTVQTRVTFVDGAVALSGDTFSDWELWLGDSGNAPAIVQVYA